MNNLYHIIPPNLEGDTLYPLNELKLHKPHIYQKAVQKYKGREVLLSRKIPLLDCLWNDVLHFSPIHPSKIFAALYEIRGKKWLKKPWRFFKVNPTEMDFNAENTVVYLNSPREKGDFNTPPTDFLPFNTNLLPKYQKLPPSTLAHYQEAFAHKTPLFLYATVPHILHKGSLEISKLEVIEVS